MVINCVNGYEAGSECRFSCSKKEYQIQVQHNSTKKQRLDLANNICNYLSYDIGYTQQFLQIFKFLVQDQETVH